jgi:hypothetical protein
MKSRPSVALALLFLMTILGAEVRTSAGLLAQVKSVRKLAPPHRAAPSKRTKKAPSSKKAVAGKSRLSTKHGGRSSRTAKATTKHRRGAPITAYRLGHGDNGVGTITPPTPYTAPPPTVAVGPATISPSSLPGEILYADQLDRFFKRLQALETGDNQQTVRMLQFGDSHTAADMFTGRMRSLFQQKFGNGGAGFTYAGHPFPGYRILGTSRAQTVGWIDEGVHFTKIVNTELGLGGVANTSTQLGDTISLDAPCSLLQVQYLDQPGGGGFSVSEDGRVLSQISTDNPVAPETFESPCTDTSGDGGIHHFEMVADSSRPVRLLGTVTERPGVTYEALGLNGAEAALILRWDQPIFANYLKQRDPSLIVLAYGTNEASNHNWTYESYSALMARVVDSLHAANPEAAILVIGPPDRSLKVGRHRAARWQTFDGTLHISDAQRDVCRTHGCAFWDWRLRMGGLGSMNRWASDGLAQADHTHFTSAGYIHLADLFYSDMIAAYDAWRGLHPVISLTVPTSSH